MRTLGPSSRAALAGAAFVSFAAAYATVPIIARGEVPPIRATPTSIPAPAPPSVAVVMPRRDPFAGQPPFRGARQSLDQNAAAQPYNAPAAIIPPMPAFPGAALPIAPPPGVVTPASRPRELPRVTAIITGAHPTALVQEDGSTSVVTVGDRVGDDRVVAIDLEGVLLAHGALLRIAPSPGGT